MSKVHALRTSLELAPNALRAWGKAAAAAAAMTL